VRSLSHAALTLLLAGTGTSLLALAALTGTAMLRQTARAAPVHPAGVAAGLAALPVALTCWRIARHRLDRVSDAPFRAWSLREA
jgi:hypothetical protein